MNAHNEHIAEVEQWNAELLWVLNTIISISDEMRDSFQANDFQRLLTATVQRNAFVQQADALQQRLHHARRQMPNTQHTDDEVHRLIREIVATDDRLIALIAEKKDEIRQRLKSIAENKGLLNYSKGEQ
jgi:hypothetical protein